MTRHMIVGAACLALCVACLHAQSEPSEPRFDVASVKRNVSGIAGAGPKAQAGQVVIRGEPLVNIIWTAYGGRRSDFRGLPRWAMTEAFDITASGNGAATAMLRTLLRERFSLQMHLEEQMDDAYAVKRVDQDKLGPQLRPSATDCAPKDMCTGRLSSGSNVGTGVKWEALLERIRVAAGRPVVDETGLSGYFDFELTWTPGLAVTPDAGVDIFQALRDQLGLKLESTQAPRRVWVVDQVEHASPD